MSTKGLMSIHDGPESLRDAARLVRLANRDHRRAIYQAMRETMNPEWRNALEEHARTRLEEALILPGARIAAGNPPTIYAGNSKKRAGRALTPVEHWRLAEHGADRDRARPYDRKNRRRPGSHKVTRRTQTGWKPRQRGGYVIGPAIGEVLPRLTSFFVQSVIRTYADALDRKA